MVVRTTMKKFRGQTNAFSVGSGSTVLNVPKEIAEEFDINNEKRKTYFNIYTEYAKGKKRIIYEFFEHAKRVELNAKDI